MGGVRETPKGQSSHQVQTAQATPARHHRENQAYQYQRPPTTHHQGLLHFVAFFHVASMFSTGVDNEKVGVDNEKALELDIFFSYFSLILI